MHTQPGLSQRSMKKEERAIIHTLNVGGEDVTVSKFYGTTVDMSERSLRIRARKKLLVGENVEILLHIEGQGKPFNLSGVITLIEESKEKPPSYLITVTLNQKTNQDTSLWRKIFH